MPLAVVKVTSFANVPSPVTLKLRVIISESIFVLAPVYKVLHLFVVEPKSYVTFVFGMICELTSPPKTILSVSASPKFTSPLNVEIPVMFIEVPSIAPTLYLSVPVPTVPLVSLLTISTHAPACAKKAFPTL